MARSKPSKPSKPQQPAPSSPSSLPPWPKFKPPLPVVDLFPTPHPLTNKVVTLDAFFPRSLCRDYVAHLSALPLQTTPGTPRRGDAVRVNDRLQTHDASFAAALWEKTGLREALLQDDVASLW
ncbi:hypothetical protein BBAD15_g10267 [Beauveria bassiana D1-5]|uniref:Uncharacterized protein n=1 Tax=Beauveria bassiana D1-5 TaxID=1245745 RepID=A0A0A2VDT1_BEABA|nr:hypothetical protein BBAD15_g10267 [Beauveria bassiana D1-5]